MEVIDLSLLRISHKLPLHTVECTVPVYYISDHIYIRTGSLVPPAIGSNSIVRCTHNCQLLSKLVVWSGEECLHEA